MLALAAANQVPATDHCLRLIRENGELALSSVDAPAATSFFVGREVDTDVREQRRLRREQQKAKKAATKSPVIKKPASTKQVKMAKAALVVRDQSTKLEPVAEPVNREPVAVSDRRRPLLTPAESAQFDSEHPVAGWLVECEVPFTGARSDGADAVVEGSTRCRDRRVGRGTLGARRLFQRDAESPAVDRLESPGTPAPEFRRRRAHRYRR
jgi:hypothetical protein